MKIEMWPVDKAIDYARNARKITDKAVDKVAASIKEFGFRQPVVVDKEGVIIIGHVRRRSAKKLGLAEIPVHVAADLTPGQVKALRIMDNRSSDEVQFDFELLGPELLDLKGLGIDLSLTGFDIPELDRIMNIGGPTEGEDDVPEAPVNPVSRLGDLWLLDSGVKSPNGETLSHRVYCGDSTKAEDVSVVLGGVAAPFLMTTDPPYSVDLDPGWRVAAGLQHRTPQRGKIANDDQADWSSAYRHFPGDVAYIWHAGVFAGEVAVGLHSVDFQIRAQIIWKKQRIVISRGAYHWAHEPCWYAVRKGKPARWSGDRTQSTVWEVDNLLSTNQSPENEKVGHGSQKPVELFRRPILNHTTPREAIYDPFLGSGSSLIAAHLTGRILYGIDIDRAYTDVSVKRWAKIANREPRLHNDGRTFAEVAAQRASDAKAAA
jgi:DNA modification methylase